MDNLRVPVTDESGNIVKTMFQEFLKTFGNYDLDESFTFQQKLAINYDLQIRTMVQNNRSTIFVDFCHVSQANPELAEAIEMEFYRFEPYLRYALQEMVSNDNQHYVFDIDKGQREFFVAFYNFPRIERIRSMGTEKIGRLIAISGTVTRSSEVRPELLFGCFICKKCGASHQSVEQQFQYTEPQICKNPQCSNASDFQILLDKCAFVDWQRLRVQENADEIPPGSMPRCIDVICRNEIVEIAKAGDKVILTGNVAVVPDTKGLARVGESTVSGKMGGGRGDSQFTEGVHGLRKLGVKEMTYKILFIASSVQHTDQRTGVALGDDDRSSSSNEEEEDGDHSHTSTSYNASTKTISSSSSFIIPTGDTGEGGAAIDNYGETDFDGSSSSNSAVNSLSSAEQAEIVHMHSQPHLYDKMVQSICPSVFGHQEVKRGVLLMLFGGVHKKTQEGISLRGDLNICIVGDPSCAKSQFLKYVHGFLPRTVYTSGKSSSAAGLTASVVRDAETGEFCVEAGALMLADNGICCIDEFDKMDPHDQVAIHEAMEQQTISITKAGIQATLNARTSILAAANPVYGRYDRTKTLKANVAVSAAIMSRFDLFFVILDECNAEIDTAVAKHIVGVHKKGGLERVSTAVPFTRSQVQRYIQFARTIQPIFSTEAKPVLVESYRLLRQNDLLGKNKTAYRITVRQLESLIRLSEGLARLHLDEYVRPVYVREAYRLLQKSIIFVETEDIELEDNEEEMNIQVSRNSAAKRGNSVVSKRSRVEKDIIDENYISNNNDENEEEKDHTIPIHDDRDMDELSPATTTTTAAAAAESKKKKKKQEEDSSSNTKTVLPPNVVIPAATARSTTTKITARAYDEISMKLQAKLSEEEERNADFRGMQWRMLLAWYLTENFDATSGEEFDAKRKLVNQVIRRLIKHESTVMVVVPVDSKVHIDDIPNEDKMLKLHPSHQL